MPDIVIVEDKVVVESAPTSTVEITDTQVVATLLNPEQAVIEFQAVTAEVFNASYVENVQTIDGSVSIQFGLYGPPGPAGRDGQNATDSANPFYYGRFGGL